MFNGFSVGATTDYLFLHPAILAALYFIRRGNPERTRAFVISVARAVAENIETNRGLMVSNGVIATVDQLWAARLLLELRTLHQQQGLDAVSPPTDEREVRDLARTRFRGGLEQVRDALRLWVSNEAGYRRRVAQTLLVLAPVGLAVLAAVLLFKHPGEGIASVIVGVLVAIGIGYYFFFKEAVGNLGCCPRSLRDCVYGFELRWL